MEGGNPFEFFLAPELYGVHFDPGHMMTRWAHFLSARVLDNCLLGYVRFFMGPTFPGNAYCVRLCKGVRTKKCQITEPVAAHAFVYDSEKGGTRDGILEQIAP